MAPKDLHVQSQIVMEQGQPASPYEVFHGTPPVNSPTSYYQMLFDSVSIMTTVSPRDLQVQSPSSTSSRKRSSLSLSDSAVSQEEPEKRQRLTSPKMGAPDTVASSPPLLVDPFFAIPAAPPEPMSDPMSAPMPDVSMENMQTLDSHEFTTAELLNIENEEEFIEVGPDGLRLVKDCLADIFEYNKDGLRVCKLCL